MRFLWANQIDKGKLYLAMDVATASNDISHSIFYPIAKYFLRSELPGLSKRKFYIVVIQFNFFKFTPGKMPFLFNILSIICIGSPKRSVGSSRRPSPIAL